MELYEEILLDIFKKEKCFPEHAEALVLEKAYQTLEKIKLILEEDQLDDKECFNRIEKIVRLYEELGSGCGNRHDFG